MALWRCGLRRRPTRNTSNSNKSSNWFKSISYEFTTQYPLSKHMPTKSIVIDFASTLYFVSYSGIRSLTSNQTHEQATWLIIFSTIKKSHSSTTAAISQALVNSYLINSMDCNASPLIKSLCRSRCSAFYLSLQKLSQKPRLLLLQAQSKSNSHHPE